MEKPRFPFLGKAIENPALLSLARSRLGLSLTELLKMETPGETSWILVTRSRPLGQGFTLSWAFFYWVALTHSFACLLACSLAHRLWLNGRTSW
ncbi:uncharacterized protein BO87DRAFT_379480 [Aspergillus neoniger CBS 115656]|uniref:Uncharacterized protein n=1 Tax=Aspergillus neoniger (strain CBS 115656) TaxID=1448310 RepID=A0A318Z146_ASPNB|nr:hypothetical protein BO87DRAFT_379480 [Aspergillus neoniger CBS 115656]PYH30812.1 hypothetical protein BO87DRAFT_379480 [Aspergillus neoniger CBS 115656]